MVRLGVVVIGHDIEASLRVASLDCNYLSLIMKFTGNELFGFWETILEAGSHLYSLTCSACTHKAPEIYIHGDC